MIHSRPLAVAYLAVALLCSAFAGVEGDHGSWWSALWMGLLAVSFAWRGVRTLAPPSPRDLPAA